MNQVNRNQNFVGDDQKAIIKAAIYARYSSDMQSPESANDQIERIRYYNEKQMFRLLKYPPARYNIQISDEWILKDEAESGKVADRAGYELIIQGIRQNQFNVLLVDDLSRLTRSLGDQIDLYNLLQFKGIELYSVCEGISSEAPNSKTFFQIKGMVNELGNDLNALRTRRGKEARALKGFSTGDSPYGYMTRPTQFSMRNGREVPSHYEILIDPQQAKIVDLVDEMFLAGKGRPAIARELNKRGVPGSSRSQKISGKNSNWNSTVILYMLRNQRYSGFWDWGKTKTVINPESKKRIRIEVPQNEWIQHFEGKEPRTDLVIRPIERWKRILEILENNKKEVKENCGDKLAAANKRRKPGKRGSHLLTGILTCGMCGGPMCLVASKSYGCYSYYRKGERHCNSKRTLRRAKVEEKITAAIQNVILDDEYLKSCTKLLNDRIKEKLRVTPEELQNMERREKDLENEIQNLMDFIIIHGNSSQRLKDSLETKERDLAYVKQRVAYLKTAKIDKLLMTPFVLRDRFQRLTKKFIEDPVQANLTLRDLIPHGIKCIPTGDSAGGGYTNQWNSSWSLTGELAIAPGVGAPINSGSGLGLRHVDNGGGGEIRTLGTE